MFLVDEWAERHISSALKRGELDNLSGEGKPLVLDDDSHVPADLRVGYRLLKNAGCLPPEIEQRKEAATLASLLRGLSREHPDFIELNKRLAVLEFRLQQAGMSTDFLHTEYADKFIQHFDPE
ncbi:DnaJ family domain-containing protein [Obesumbacterium proteus]|uniref:DnaJ family domain-containing protein n=1 Tax=Obesumbacterium proteus TaxID=82983 RepID=UPI0006221655|nr:DUF1992 domain-containing protein [Obesumbacterium proteus]MDN6548517.1 DUF1992 domain-containing protein [Enterobacterales bacterium]KKI47356.1 hypothetical protein XK97_10245 [Obesumbacterium proteus]MCE9885921.1 DUF1992 domain-containing protein [Obesumbacterium proteus]MCE9915777.1 DUF1992 domain-containing protein [Obesumbacterium proteus]MCE9931798.1 DUF1992 domain-containing protein [Obesumbacterium proteus]